MYLFYKTPLYFVVLQSAVTETDKMSAFLPCTYDIDKFGFPLFDDK